MPFFDSKITATGMPRGDQRKIYDARKAKLIPENGKMLVIIDYRDLKHRKGKIVRNPEKDLLIVDGLLERAIRSSRPEAIINSGIPVHPNN